MATLLIIVVAAFIQSFFGVGVLVFGTPILLLLGYDFPTTLCLLLPVSCAISIAQVSGSPRDLDLKFYKKILLIAVPLAALCLFFALKLALPIKLVVGLLVLLVSLKELISSIKKVFSKALAYESFWIVGLGIIHGLSNLGGSILAALVYSKGLNKNSARTTIAASYGSLAFLQITVLLITSSETLLTNLWDIIGYVIFGLGSFTISEAFFYSKMNSVLYQKIFAVLLFCIGVVLILGSVGN